MSDPFWTLWATPTRRSGRTPLEEYLRLEYPNGDGTWLLAAARKPARTPARSRGPIPPPVDRPRTPPRSSAVEISA